MTTETYTVRLRNHAGDVHVVEMAFSQLCELLPPRHRNEEQRIAERNFWHGIGSLDGPYGTVKIIKTERLQPTYRYAG